MEIATRRREQEVWQACDDLWALHGSLPDLTGDAIRDRLLHLGKSRGSPNELYKYRKTWIKSRGLNNAPVSSSPLELDPISRAVKLVHEHLKTEALEELNLVKQDFLEKIRNRDEELAKAKRAMEAVMMEFSEIQSQLLAKASSLKTLDQQLAAEIEMRKASEREITNLRNLREQEKSAQENLLKEVKDLHINEMEKHRSLETLRFQQQNSLIEKLIEEKKQLGVEFSEKLNELKTLNYNQDVRMKLLEANLANLQADKNQTAQVLAEKDQEIATLKEIAAGAALSVTMTTQEMSLLRERATTQSAELEKITNINKRSLVTIARLRAVLARDER
ncbi:MAG TPA: hypothetical protein VEL47_01405 [Myxococcota bacterium]|nr:hypothetical protein [Myxococcota bacterium]